MLTRNGVELNLEESIYKYNYKGLTFYFSSMFYLKKFEKEVKNYIDNESKKMYNKFKVNVDYTILFSLALYKSIEKRGFRVLIHDNEPIESYNLHVSF